MKVGYGTYGMPKLSVCAAVAAAAEIGYDGIELACLPNGHATPDKLDAAERRAIKAKFDELGVELPALMLGLNAMADDQAPELERLKQACELAHELAVGDLPVLVSTTGGSWKQWEADKERGADNIIKFAEVAGEAGLSFALEPHVGGFVHRPEQAEWVRQRSGGLPSLQFNYDHSHFILQDIPPSVAAPIMVPHAVATHLKCAEGDMEHVKFLLPGESDFNYPAFVKLLDDLGYDGYLTVEVSGMIWNQPDYDPIEAAKFCYQTLRGAIEAAGVTRG